MTMPRRVELPCPQCGHLEQVMTYVTVNTGVNPGLREQLLNDQVNVFHCSVCAHEDIVTWPLLYHDPTLRFCVQYYQTSTPPEELVSQFEPRWPPTLAMPALGPAEYLTQPHVVFDWDEMLRSIVFFEAILGRGSGDAPSDAHSNASRHRSSTGTAPSDSIVARPVLLLPEWKLTHEDPPSRRMLLFHMVHWYLVDGPGAALGVITQDSAIAGYVVCLVPDATRQALLDALSGHLGRKLQRVLSEIGGKVLPADFVVGTDSAHL
jgi:hypothetical protein